MLLGEPGGSSVTSSRLFRPRLSTGQSSPLYQLKASLSPILASYPIVNVLQSSKFPLSFSLCGYPCPPPGTAVRHVNIPRGSSLCNMHAAASMAALPPLLVMSLLIFTSGWVLFPINYTVSPSTCRPLEHSYASLPT